MSTILITGGTGTIGSAIAAEFAATDDVVFTYNSRADEAQRLCGELRCSAVRCDVSDYASCEAAAEKVLKDYGRIDVLVNNAGISQIKLFTDITPEDWQRVMNVDLNGVYNMTHAVIRSMINRKSGAVVNVSSVWGVYGGACESAYSAAKAGVVGLTKGAWSLRDNRERGRAWGYRQPDEQFAPQPRGTQRACRPDSCVPPRKAFGGRKGSQGAG